jgi:hypothetical protein
VLCEYSVRPGSLSGNTKQEREPNG